MGQPGDGCYAVQVSASRRYTLRSLEERFETLKGVIGFLRDAMFVEKAKQESGVTLDRNWQYSQYYPEAKSRWKRRKPLLQRLNFLSHAIYVSGVH